MVARRYLYLLFLFLASPLPLQAKETIRWLWYEQAPYFIGNDVLEGNGTGNKLLLFYQKNLPEYNHQNVKVTIDRYNKLIQEDNICVPVAWKSSHERKNLIHTKAHTIEPPTGIFVHRNKINMFGEPDSMLSLENLLQETYLTLGIIENMNYSKKTDELISKYKNSSNVVSIKTDMIQINLKMLKLNRLDYLLGSPSQISELIINNLENEYIFYNALEIPNYIPIYTHCSNNKIGEEIISKVNLLLSKKKLLKDLKIYDYWYGNNKTFSDLYIHYVINGLNSNLIQDL